MRLYTHLSEEDREKIYRLNLDGISFSAIAKELNRSVSTISREIKRNSCKRCYLPDTAHNKAKMRRHRAACKIEKYHDVKEYVLDRLCNHKWSPEMIAGRMKMEGKEICVSHESIYQYVYSAQGQLQKLYQHLMYARPKRQLKYARRHRKPLPEQYKISNRPDVINNRQEFGHFEGDLTFFKSSRNGNLTVLVERLSRKTFIIKNNTKRSANVMINILKIHQSLPVKTIQSITFDNGGEFQQFGLLTLNGTNVYFCDPAAPYQKGQVERTNAVLHKFIKKKSNFHNISIEDVLDAQNKLNNLPRKCLNFLTPNEAWDIHSKHIVALQT